MTDTTLGQRIAEGRKKLGLSQEAFGERLGVSRQAASKWESDAAVPEIDKLITMSKIFGVSIGWLLGVEDPEAPTETTLSEEQLAAVTELLCRYPTPCPERKGRKWFIAACAAGLAMSLALGSVGLFLPKVTTDNTALQNQIDVLAGRNAQLQQQIEDLSSQLADSANEQARKLETFQNDLEQLELELKTSDLPGSTGDNTELPEEIFPGAGVLDSWTLSPKIDPSKDSAALRFSGFTAVDSAQARLIAILGGYEMASAVCERTAVGYAGELELPRVNGYTYYFELTYDDGTTERIELTGHGLSDLSVSTEPSLTCTTADGLSVTTGSQFFWLTKPTLSLSVPDSIAANTSCVWTELRLVYYCNDKAAAQQDLSKKLDELPQDSHQISLELYNIIFSIADFTAGSSHTVRLEGALSVNGLEQVFSLPIGHWIMKGGKLVDAAETE